LPAIRDSLLRWRHFQRTGTSLVATPLGGAMQPSRATFVRHSQEKMGPSANDLMTAIRMAMTANEIRNSSSSTGSIAKSVGYQSEAGFQRALSSI
jgi:AraC-like DNA-binding protein